MPPISNRGTPGGTGMAIGTGGVLPEMEEAVIGLTAGGSRQTRVRFGDDHRARGGVGQLPRRGDVDLVLE